MPQAPALLPIPYASYLHQHEKGWHSENPFENAQMQIDTALKANEHRIEITQHGANLWAGNTQSLAEASNTFSQLIKLNGAQGTSAELPAVTIQDSPEYAWRSLQLDLTTGDYSIELLENLLNILALYKINVVQLVLGSNQAWRMEIKGYSKIKTSYSQDELRQLAEFASERGITLVPVVDLPTGARPVISAYPVLGVVNAEPESEILGAHPAAFQFVQDVLNQLADVFPGPFVQVGNIGSSLSDWATIPAVNRERFALGLSRDFELTGHFMQLCQETLEEVNRRLILPDTTDLMRLPKDVVVLVQNNLNTVLELTARGYQVIFTQSNSLNLAFAGTLFSKGRSAAGLYRGLANLMQQDEFRPLATQRTLILGFMAHFNVPKVTEAEIYRLLFPRIIVFAQQMWNGPRRQSSWRTFKQRLASQNRLLENFRIQL